MKTIKVFKDKQRLQFLQESCEGIDLYSHLVSLGSFNKQESQFYISTILLTVSYLHSVDILHRDLKPENFLIDSSGHLKLVEVSTCKKIKDRTFTLVGTPCYTAPEAFLLSGYGLASDFWSIGVCLFEFMTGRLPFGEDTDDPLKIFQEILENKEISFPRECRDTHCMDLIRRLLRKEPEERLCNLRKIQKHPWFSSFDFVSICVP